VFAGDLERRVLAQTWQAEFHSSLPRLLDWLEQRPRLAAVEAEVELRRELAGTHLAGRADRIEIRADGTRAVIDYKTGKLPKAEAVETGEAVQLLHYALLDPSITAVEYLALREKEQGFGFEAQLPALRAAVETRLDRALRRVHAGAPLPAHGHEEVCKFCAYPGLCRLEDWHD
jgi:ATP-dependent helicase/nuclease subunit B